MSTHTRTEPFFLFISYLEPHHQNHLDDYPAPVGYREQYTGRWTPPDLAALGGSSPQHLGGYYGMVKRLDEAFGRLLDALRSLDLLENTVVLFTSDHGCHFKTRNAEYKRSCHESSIRVPTALCGPGFDGGGQTRRAGQPRRSAAHAPGRRRPAHPAEHAGPFDLAPAAGEPAALAGGGLRPDQRVRRCAAPSARSAGNTASVRPGLSGWEQAGSDRYVEEALYDLEADPYELENLAGIDAFRAVADDLRQRLIARMVAAGEAAPIIEDAPVRPGGQRATTIAEVRQRYNEQQA